MRSGIFDALDIEGIEISDVIRTAGQYTFTANLIDGKPGSCCDNQQGNLIRWNHPERRFRDLKMNGKFVEVVVYPQRYKCNACGKILRETIPSLHDSHRLTSRLVDHIIYEAGRRTFAEISEELGITVSRGRRVFIDNMVKKMKDHEFEMPRVLGIDEKYIHGAYIVVIGDVENCSFLDIIGSKDKEVLREYFQRKNNRDKVEVVTSDMDLTYKDIAEEFFPKAKIVIDKWHVLKTANEAMDQLRIDLLAKEDDKSRIWYKLNRSVMLTRPFRLKDSPKNKRKSEEKRKVVKDKRDILEKMFTEYPLLKVAHAVMDGMYRIYDAKSKSAAYKRYIKWRSDMPLSMRHRFRSLPYRMKTRSDHIFNYFDHRFTNAYIESLNRFVGDLNRDGRGYRFETLKSKLFIAHGGDYRVRPEFEKVRVQPWTETEYRDVLEFLERVGTDAEREYAQDALMDLRSDHLTPGLFSRGGRKKIQPISD